MTASSPRLHRPLAALLVVILVASGAPATRATVGTVVADSGPGNGIASGRVVRADPDNARVTVTNGFHFWAALDVSYVGTSNFLRPTDPREDLGGIFAGGGLIGPGSTAAWDGPFGPASQALVRVHYDLSSAGGAAALAANLLTIIADSLGASLSASSSTRLLGALQAITSMSSWADFVRQAQTNDIWGLVTSVELMLGSKTGRDTLRYALAQLSVNVSDAGLLKAASVVGIIDWAWTLFDIYRAVLLGQNDGTVIFSVTPPVVTPGPTATAAATLRPTPTATPPSGRPGTFRPTGRLVAPQLGATATLLADGRVLIAGGCGSEEGRPVGLAIAEIYDPSTGTFAMTGRMVTPHCTAAAILLPNGMVLIAGGDSFNAGEPNIKNTPIAAAELFDPRTGTFQATGDLVDPRSGLQLVALPNGDTLVVDGVSTGYRSTAATELYDYQSGRFASGGPMSAPRTGAAVASLSNGDVLVAGGSTFTQVVTWLDTSEIYSHKQGKFSRAGNLTAPRDGIAAMPLASGARAMLLAGGRTPTAESSVAELFDESSGTFAATGNLRVARQSSGIAGLPDGSILIVGGYDIQVNPVVSAEIYDPLTGQFRSAPPLEFADRVDSVTRLADGSVLVIHSDGSAEIYS